MTIKKSPGNSAFVLLATILLCACHKEEPKPAPPPAGAEHKIVSAEKTSFDEVTAKLNPGGNLYLYLSTEQVMRNLSAKISSASNFIGNLPNLTGEKDTIEKVFDFASFWVKDSGVEQISGLGMSSIAREPGFYYSKLVVHHYPGQDNGLVWSVFGKSAHPLAELDLLPEETVLASFGDVDIPLIWKSIQDEAGQVGLPAVSQALDQWPAQFKSATGLDFNQTLASLGGDYGVILTLDADKKINLPLGGGSMELPSPGLAFIAKVKSDLIFDRVAALGKNNPLVVSVDSPALKMRTMALPIPLPVEVRPSIARSGDYLFLASSDTLIREIVDVKSGKTKGFKSTPEFARLSQDIPSEGNNFTLVASRFVQSVRDIQAQALTNKGNLSSSQAQSLQQMFGAATNGGNYSVSVNGPEGWEGFANGGQSAQSMLVPAAAFGVGLASAIAIPNFVRARGVSQKNACINNLRLLDSAKQQWALEKGKSASDTPTMEDLKPYLTTKIKCPAGGEYKIGSVGEKPTCSIPGHELP